MYNSAFSSSEFGRSQQNQRNRSLHGSQSHYNLQQSNLGGFNESFGASHNAQQQYIPGYLMSASQGLPPPNSAQQVNLAPLETQDGMKRGSVSYSSFGSESLLGMPRPSPKGRSPRVAVTFDDENAPPTASIMDGGFGAPDPAPSKLTHRHSIGGFHPYTPSPLGASNSSYMSTSTEGEATSHGGPSPSFPVTVFGFLPEQRKSVVSSFVSMSSGATVDYPAGEYSNWVTIIYPDEVEAARAMRRNGEVLHGVTMIGVKWANLSSLETQQGGNLPRSSATSNLAVSPSTEFGTLPASHGRSSSNAANTPSTFSGAGRPLTLKPSSTAFRKDMQAPNVGGSVRGVPGELSGDGSAWGLTEYQRKLQASKAQESSQPEGVLGQVNRLIFGW